MARPTKYTPKLLEKANTYLKKWKDEGDAIPSVEALAGYLEVSRSTLYNWGDEHSEFLDILGEVNRLQAKTLINNGLTGEFNSNITKLVLGKHGFSEKTQQELSGPNGQPIETNFTVTVIDATSYDTE